MRPQDFRRAFIDKICERQLLPPEQAEAILQQTRVDEPLPDRLVENGVDSEQVLEVVGEILDIPAVSLSVTAGDPTIVDVLPRARAFALHALPLYSVEQQLTVALSEPWDLSKLDEVRFISNQQIIPVFALQSDLDYHLPLYYEDEDEEDALEYTGVGEETAEAGEPPQDGSFSLDGDEERPVVRLVNLIFKSALADGATDIHLEPQTTALRVRYRVDGILQDKPFQIPADAARGISSRIKVLASLDITERRTPQDGKLALRFQGRRVDVRVSTFPTIHGEKLVLRVLDKERQQLKLTTIGMSPEILGSWRRTLGCREGIVLVTGPTGSGKTSTLYSCLQEIHRPEINIVTLENPVEYELPGISQCQIDPASGMTFAAGLRSILRQDPDVIMVGEIRDRETAEVAMQAAQTGHLVFATMHTNDAPSAVTRLIEMGVPKYLVASCVRAVLAQRLVRRLCPHCRERVEPTLDERRFLGPWMDGSPTLLDGKGCPKCNQTGYRGRTGVYELLVIERPQRSVIAGGCTDDELVAACDGYRPLWSHGIEKVRAEQTSLRELARWVEPGDAPAEEPPLRVPHLALASQQ